MKLSILCPTRERPEGALRMAESAHDCAHGSLNVSISFYVAEDDPRLADYERMLPLPSLMIGPFVPTSRAWNALWRSRNGADDMFMLGSDDILFTPFWDEALVDAGPRNVPAVLHMIDSRHPTNTPHPIVTRRWTEVAGYFLPPQFNHYYVDQFTCWAAKLSGLFRAVDSVLVHDKVEASSSRFPWTAEWLAKDREEWARSLPNLEILMSKLLRETGR